MGESARKFLYIIIETVLIKINNEMDISLQLFIIFCKTDKCETSQLFSKHVCKDKLATQKSFQVYSGNM